MALIVKNAARRGSFASPPGGRRSDTDGLSRRLVVQTKFRAIDPLTARRLARRVRS
jgi:hypothetical protein